MYLDNELIYVEHLCCLAHARANFKYAYDQGSLLARIFLELIAKLYGMEDTYRREKLTADEIYRRRNSKEMTEIIDKLITVQRKNSFGSVKGIQNFAIYNTFIETCKQAGVSFRDYFCKLLRELKKGRTDYENLLPMTICK